MPVVLSSFSPLGPVWLLHSSALAAVDKYFELRVLGLSVAATHRTVIFFCPMTRDLHTEATGRPRPSIGQKPAWNQSRIALAQSITAPHLVFHDKKVAFVHEMSD
ncbi:hypothetical protein LZ32DRAFT_151232 [Colletotrichum eremochloae]|nr:hypothetical protein LZ32DRAFT_151232 [Colletotrichum eremochloae]